MLSLSIRRFSPRRMRSVGGWMAILSIKGAATSVGGIPTLAGVDLTVQDGEFCVLAGPSGAGKSTLLRAIAGLERLDSGTIEIDGEVVNAWRPHERNVALVFQTEALLPTASAYENIAFSLKARKVPHEEVDVRVKRVAEVLGVADLLHRRPDQLQLAERRRVAIGRAAVRDADVCLMDEPLANLDIDSRDAIRAEIKALHREFPTTKLFVTHDALEAATLGDRVVVMRAGRVEQEGSPQALFERPLTRFVAGFFGRPKMNFLGGTLVRSEAIDQVRLDSGEISVKLPPNRIPKDVADGLAVILGLRPEHMMRAVRVSPPDGVFRHDAEVEALQPVGTRTYATFRVAGAPVVAELQAHDVSLLGERIPIDINIKRASIFDAETEKAL
jgi:multiple sugar transport system ATP-binding protein